MFKLNHIVCSSSNGVIGRDGNMPWHLPEDLKHFKKTTMGCPIIMGRKTYESIGKPLPGRLNVVLTRDASYNADGVEVVTSMDTAIRVAKEHLQQSGAEKNELFIIGGGQLYKQTINMVDRIYLTKIHRMIDGDTRYVPIPESDFLLVEKKDAENASEKLSFMTYQRIKH